MNRRYLVPVTYTLTKELKVWARDEEAAQEKAKEIVLDWRGTTSAEAGQPEEIDNDD